MVASEMLSGAIARVKAEKVANAGPPLKVPRRLPLQSIQVEPLVFQVRSEGLCDVRVSEIARGLVGSNLDEPIHVWWSGQRWIVIDGHHRHAAYHLKAEKTGKALSVPVVAHLDTTLEAAMGYAGRLNDREKVKISQADKLDNAWRVVCMAAGSINEQSNETGVAKSTISNMRQVRNTLAKRRLPDRQLIDAGWVQCREWTKGRVERDHCPEALEARAYELADELRKLKITTILKSPDVFARALEILSPELPDRLIQSDPFWGPLNTTGRELLQEFDLEQADQGLLNSDAVEDF